MPRYIDAENLSYFIGERGQILCRKEVIDKTPTADVEEVRHGAWEMIPPPKKYQAGAYVKFRCSECGIEFESSSKYCRCCGAHMDGKGSE